MEKGKKHKIVEELGTKLKGLDVMFLAEYSGMNVSQVTRLRKELGNADADFSVTKNSLLRLASEGTYAEALKDQYTGPNAIICVYKDPVNAAKVLSTFAKEISHLKLKAGFLGKRVLTPDEILKLATLPSREILIGKFLGLLQGMPQRLLYVLSGNLTKLMTTLEAIKNKKAEA